MKDTHIDSQVQPPWGVCVCNKSLSVTKNFQVIYPVFMEGNKKVQGSFTLRHTHTNMDSSLFPALRATAFTSHTCTHARIHFLIGHSLAYCSVVKITLGNENAVEKVHWRCFQGSHINTASVLLFYFYTRNSFWYYAIPIYDSKMSSIVFWIELLFLCMYVWNCFCKGWTMAQQKHEMQRFISSLSLCL